MKIRRIIIILVLAAFINPAISSGKKVLVAFLSTSTFNTSSGSSYFETYLTVIGQTAFFVKDSSNKYQSKINIVVSFFKDSTLVLTNNYNLKSEEITDTLSKPDFIDAQRYWLPKGAYSMKITMKDLYNPNGKARSLEQKINVGYEMDSVRISDVEFLQSYTASNKPGILNKSGYDMIPYVYNYYPEELNEIKFYAEVYNAYKIAGEHGKFIVKYLIASAETNVALFEYNRVSVQQADTINPILGGFNIKGLPSGGYYLKIEIIDKTNSIKASRTYNFIRHNPNTEISMKNLGSVNIANTFVNKINDKDSLIEFIKCLDPIANLSEQDFARSKGLRAVDFTLLKQFFYNFWQVRNSVNPEDAWQKYYVQVNAVNKKYGNCGTKGYQTDQGRVYLHYGAPNQLVRSEINPATYPYEIWEYYRLSDGETDRKFVFYEPGAVGDCYVLLHSDARGEVQNRQWQLLLYSRKDGMPSDVDQNRQTDPFGENTMDQFSNPR